MSLGSDFDGEFAEIMLVSQNAESHDVMPEGGFRTVGDAIRGHVSGFTVSAGYENEYAFGMSANDFLSLTPTELGNFLSSGQFHYVSVYEASLLVAIAYDFTRHGPMHSKTFKSLDYVVRRLGHNGHTNIVSMDKWPPEKKPSLRMSGSCGTFSCSKVGVEVSSLLTAIRGNAIGLYCIAVRDNDWLADIDMILANMSRDSERIESIEVVECQSCDSDDDEIADDKAYVVLVQSNKKTCAFGIYMSEDDAGKAYEVASHTFDALEMECKIDIIYAPFFK